MVTAVARLVLGSRRRTIGVVVLWIVLASVIPRLAPSLADVENNDGINDPPAAAESIRARDLVHEAFPDQRGVPAVVVFQHSGGLSEPDFAAVREFTDALNGPAKPDHVRGAVSITTAPQATDLLSADRSTAVVLVPILGSPEDPAFNTAVDDVRKAAGPGTEALRVKVTGPAGIVRDTIAVFAGANLVLLFGTLVLVLLLLLLIYRSPLLAVIPLVSAGIAIEVTNGLGAWLVRLGLFDVSGQAASIMTVLLFGVGTDYCLFVVSRYREELVGAADRRTAMTIAVARVSESIVSSAATVILGLLVLLTATLPALRSFGPFLALGVATMVLVGLTFVPAVILMTGRVAWWPAGDPGHRPAPAGHSGRGLWAWVANQVIRRPGRVTVACLMVLVVLSTGLLGYRESYNFISGFRAETDSAQGQEMLNRAFPPGELAPTTVLITAADRPMRSIMDEVDDVASALARIEGVRSISEQRPVSIDGHTARLELVYTDDPYRSPALDRTGQVRQVAQATMRSHRSDARVLVGGQSAISLDLRSANQRDLRVIVPLTLLVIAVVLALMLRSLIAPIYLILTTVASLVATIGVTSFALLVVGGDEGMGIRVTAYIFIFLVALGVDYNIFLLSRVRQEVLERGPVEGLRHAVVRSGGVISSAGVILAGTFAVLMTQPLRELFQFGFAMAIGILLDALLVRGMLVPAVFRLFGRWNWWPGGAAQPFDTADHPAGMATTGTMPRG